MHLFEDVSLPKMCWFCVSHLAKNPIDATEVHADERVGLAFYQLGHLWPNMDIDFSLSL